MPSPGIEAGKRMGVFGRAGVGKTTLQRWFLLRSELRWIVMDTKHDPGFDDWRPMNGLLTMREVGNLWRRDHQFVVVRPKPDETNMRILDDYLGVIHEAWENIGILIDETYHFANGAYPGPGLIGLVTRGRARKQAVIMGAQRPARLPLFVLSESNAFAVLQLTMDADRERMAELSGRREMLERLPPRHWLYYSVDENTLSRYGPVSIRA